MKVSLGTIEIDDAQRKAIRKDLGKGGHATRDDVKTYLGAVIEAALKNAGAGNVATMQGAPDAGGLPEPTAGGSATATSTGTTTGTTAGGTTPSTGNLGSAGTPGGTV